MVMVISVTPGHRAGEVTQSRLISESSGPPHRLAKKLLRLWRMEDGGSPFTK
jgi:hypothetical protein